MPSTSPLPPFANLLVVHLDWDLPSAHRERLAPYFAAITSVPKGTPTDAQLAAADVIFGFPSAAYLRSIQQVPRLRLVQLAAAGSDEIICSPMWEEQAAEREEGGLIRLASAAGVHVEAIGQYFIATTLALYHRLQEQILINHNEKRWAMGFEFGANGSWIFVQGLRQKTVGVLGYGHIGRECARLASAFGARVVAANASGTRQPLGGYTIPGTGDPDGTLPAAWYSTASRESLETFLRQCDVVLLSAPSTPATRRLINEEALAWMKPTAILVNVGRGDVVDTDALVNALDGSKLAGVVLDVVNPEPLPDGHTLFGRKNVIVTPHVSGRSLAYPELTLDLLISNLEKFLAGEKLMNEIEETRGQ